MKRHAYERSRTDTEPGQMYTVTHSVVQSPSRVQLFVSWTAAGQTSLSPGVCSNFVHWVSDAIQPSRPLSPPSPFLNLSQHQGLFQWVRSSHQVAKVLEFSFSFTMNPSNEYSGLISFRIDWFDLFAVQGTLKSLLQHHNLRGSILWCLAFFMVQLSHPYMTTGKTIALTIWTFASKLMSLFFNMLSRFVIAFLPRSKYLNFVSAVTVFSDFEAKENKISYCFHVFPIYLPWCDGARCHDLNFFKCWVLSQLFHSPLSAS